MITEEAISGAHGVPLGNLARDLFLAWDQAGVRWALLRGLEGLPAFTRYDLDILVAPGDLARAGQLIVEVAANLGWGVIGTINKYRYRCWLLVSAGTSPHFLPVDLFAGCYHRFYEIADAGYALAHRRQTAAGIWIVPPGFGAFMTLAKELLRHDTFKDNSREETRRGIAEDFQGFMAAGAHLFKRDLLDSLREACLAGDWQMAASLAPELRRQVFARRVQELPGAVAFLWKNLVHHARPPMSMLVVLLGPDGSGKSTVASLLCKRLYQRPFKVTRHLEYNFRILPQLKQLKAWITGAREPSQTPSGTLGAGMNREHPAWRAMVYQLYYSFDLLLGRFLLRKWRAQSGLIVFARYFYDYRYQKGYRNSPGWCLSLLERLIPQPDLILFLDRDAADIYAAKPELDLPEIRHQQDRIKSLLQGRPGAVVVDASYGVEATVQAVADAVITALLKHKGLR